MDREREEADALGRAHPKFKAFSGEVEACMMLFERSKEWSDYVSALSKLIKVLQRAEYNDASKVGSLSVVPEKALLARRLSQCTNPILPGGVHRKALDAYRVILARIGHHQLAQDLALWSAGLFSLFPHANTECKRLQLRLISDLYLPLGPQLAPCMTGLVASLLPGIEDEASEFHAPTTRLLEALRDATSSRLFFASLWWVLASCPSVRQPVLRLLDAQIVQQGGLAEGRVRQVVLPGERGDAALASVLSALEDPSILVQRGVLDLLVGHFPLHSDAWDEGQWRSLVVAAVRLYGRRDMSLTRRLHSWLKVADAEGGVQPVEGFVVDRIVEAVAFLLTEEYRDTAGATMPLRVMRSLAERPDLSGILPGRLAVPLLRSLLEARARGQARPGAGEGPAPGSGGGGGGKDVNRERFQFGCSLLREFESAVLWGAVAGHLQASWGEGIEALREGLRLACFFLTEFGGARGEQADLAAGALCLVGARMRDEAEGLPEAVAAALSGGGGEGRCGAEHCVARVRAMAEACEAIADTVWSAPIEAGKGDEARRRVEERMEASGPCGESPLQLAASIPPCLVRLLALPALAEGGMAGQVVGALDVAVRLMGCVFGLASRGEALALAHGGGRGGAREGTDWLGALLSCCEEGGGGCGGAGARCVGARGLLDARDALGGVGGLDARWPLSSDGARGWGGLAASLWGSLDEEAWAREAAVLFARVQGVDERACRGVVSRALLGIGEDGGGGGQGCGGPEERLLLRRRGYARFGRFWGFARERRAGAGGGVGCDSVAAAGLLGAVDGLRDSDHSVRLLARSFVTTAMEDAAEDVIEALLLALLQSGESTMGEIDAVRVAHAAEQLAGVAGCAYRALRALSDFPVSPAVRRLDAAWVRAVSRATPSAAPHHKAPHQPHPQPPPPHSHRPSYVVQNPNDVWFRQQQAQQGGAPLLEPLPPRCDFLSATAIAASRLVAARLPSASPSEQANLRSVAAGLLAAILEGEGEGGLAPRLVQHAAAPVLLTLQAALRDNDAVAQCRLLDLLSTMSGCSRGLLLPQQGPQGGDAPTLARQLFVRTLLAGLEHPHPLDSPASGAWIAFACACAAQHRGHPGRLGGLLIPVLVSLCKRLARRCPCTFTDEASRELLSLVRAAALVLREGVPGQERAGQVAAHRGVQAQGGSGTAGEAAEGQPAQQPAAVGGAGGAGGGAGGGEPPNPSGSGGGMFGRWSMFGGSDDGAAQGAAGDEAVDTLIKLLVPPGWIPEADGTTSVLGAVLMCWGHLGPEGVGEGGRQARSGARARNVAAVRRGVLELLGWLFDGFPLQALAALMEVWDAEEAAAAGGAGHLGPGSTPGACRSIVEAAVELGRRDAGEDRVIGRCADLLVSLVRRRRSDVSFRFRFSEGAVRRFLLSYMAASSLQSSPEASLKLLHPLTAALREASSAPEDPCAALGLAAVLDAFARALPPLSERRDRRALQECVRALVVPLLALADLSLPQSGTGRGRAGPLLAAVGGGGAEGGGAAGAAEDAARQARARGRAGLEALGALAELLAPLLEKAWRDGEERVEVLLMGGDLGGQRDRSLGHLIQKVVQRLRPIIRSRTTSMIGHAGAATRVLASLNHPMFVKMWRRDVLELFQDADFFQMGASAVGCWLSLVDVAMAQEAGAFAELLAASPQAAAFRLHHVMGTDAARHNRQHADHIKRLAFVVLAGECDQYLSSVRDILERAVESLRLPSAPGVARVHRNALLCLRVLLLRVSPTSLVSFWPVALSEVLRLLRAASLPGADSDVSYAALRFLDLLMALRQEEFLLMQWAFVSDRGCDGQPPPLFSPATEALANEARVSVEEARDAFGGGGRGGAPPLLRKLEIAGRDELAAAALLLCRAGAAASPGAPRRADTGEVLRQLRLEFDEFHTDGAEQGGVAGGGGDGALDAAQGALGGGDPERAAAMDGGAGGQPAEGPTEREEQRWQGGQAQDAPSVGTPDRLDCEWDGAEEEAARGGDGLSSGGGQSPLSNGGGGENMLGATGSGGIGPPFRGEEAQPEAPSPSEGEIVGDQWGTGGVGGECARGADLARPSSPATPPPDAAAPGALPAANGEPLWSGMARGLHPPVPPPQPIRVDTWEPRAAAKGAGDAWPDIPSQSSGASD